MFQLTVYNGNQVSRDSFQDYPEESCGTRSSEGCPGIVLLRSDARG